MTYTLDVYYDRFGVLVRPYNPLLGFDYGRVYFSVEAVLEDFKLNGWRLVDRPNGLYTFHKDIRP